MRLIQFLEARYHPIQMHHEFEAVEDLVKDVALQSESDARMNFNIRHHGEYEDPDNLTPEEQKEYEEQFEAWLPDWIRDEVSNAAYNISAGYEMDEENQLVIYRVIVADSSWVNNMDARSLGVFWSWDKHAAEAHWAGKGDTTFRITGRANPNDVDWPSTLYLNTSSEEEKEIRLRDNAPVEIVDVEANGAYVDTPYHGKKLAASVGITESTSGSVALWWNPKTQEALSFPWEDGFHHVDIAHMNPGFFGFDPEMLKSYGSHETLSAAFKGGFVRGNYRAASKRLWLQLLEIDSVAPFIVWARKNVGKIDEVDVEIGDHEHEFGFGPEQIDRILMTGKLPLKGDAS